MSLLTTNLFTTTCCLVKHRQEQKPPLLGKSVFLSALNKCLSSLNSFLSPTISTCFCLSPSLYLLLPPSTSLSLYLLSLLHLSLSFHPHFSLSFPPSLFLSLISSYMCPGGTVLLPKACTMWSLLHSTLNCAVIQQTVTNTRVGHG